MTCKMLCISQITKSRSQSIVFRSDSIARSHTLLAWSILLYIVATETNVYSWLEHWFRTHDLMTALDKRLHYCRVGVTFSGAFTGMQIHRPAMCAHMHVVIHMQKSDAHFLYLNKREMRDDAMLVRRLKNVEFAGCAGRGGFVNQQQYRFTRCVEFLGIIHGGIILSWECVSCLSEIESNARVLLWMVARNTPQKDKPHGTKRSHDTLFHTLSPRIPGMLLFYR